MCDMIHSTIGRAMCTLCGKPLSRNNHYGDVCSRPGRCRKEYVKRRYAALVGRPRSLCKLCGIPINHHNRRGICQGTTPPCAAAQDKYNRQYWAANAKGINERRAAKRRAAPSKHPQERCIGGTMKFELTEK